MTAGARLSAGLGLLARPVVSLGMPKPAFGCLGLSNTGELGSGLASHQGIHEASPDYGTYGPAPANLASEGSRGEDGTIADGKGMMVEKGGLRVYTDGEAAPVRTHTIHSQTLPVGMPVRVGPSRKNEMMLARGMDLISAIRVC
jgi:hypothetical protein